MMTTLLKKMNYSKSKPIRRLKCQHFRRNWFWREWSQSRREHRLTYLDDLFLATAADKYTKNLPEKA